ncbi:hypothetical protein AVEN_265467-1 [Araneus ventricosus]|uniref:Uncharacterized protein n=1 Tax=Araneus ventricosus TaxID=182803 RepID=A0A4Y2CI56_ARAVE|nr:hypothetical protein AVEN_265467-1 [Araneus ventricosus]
MHRQIPNVTGKVGPEFPLPDFCGSSLRYVNDFSSHQDAFVAFIPTRLHVWDTPPCPPLVIVRSDRLLGAEVCTEISDFAAFAFDKSAGKGVCMCVSIVTANEPRCRFSVLSMFISASWTVTIIQKSISYPFSNGGYFESFSDGGDFYSCRATLSGRQMRTEVMNDC